MRGPLMVVLCVAAFALGARGQRIMFAPVFGIDPLALDQPRSIFDGTPVTITQFRFYVGQFAFYRAGKVISRNDAYHLIDASDSTSLMVVLDATAAAVGDSISFIVGVDSLTNVSGAFGGDLDPTNGMYWAWNSGYINMKLEGTSPASPYPAAPLELHLGGYLPPYATVQHVSLPVSGSGPWRVNVDVVPLLLSADVHTRCNVMSPGVQAVKLSKLAATMFKLHETP